MMDEWSIVIALCSAPFIAFGIFEGVGAMRSRQARARAKRSKADEFSRGEQDSVM